MEDVLENYLLRWCKKEERLKQKTRTFEKIKEITIPNTRLLWNSSNRRGIHLACLFAKTLCQQSKGKNRIPSKSKVHDHCKCFVLSRICISKSLYLLYSSSRKTITLEKQYLFIIWIEIYMFIICVVDYSFRNRLQTLLPCPSCRYISPASTGYQLVDYPYSED